MKKELVSSSTGQAVSIVPFNSDDGSVDSNVYRNLKLSVADSAAVSALCSGVPGVLAAKSMSGMYTVTFPDGMEHALMQLKQGGFSSVFYKDGASKIGGTASLFQASPQALALSAFTAMSVATAQYFLKRIDTQITQLNKKADAILNFLYGDKKAELLAQISFARFAYENYAAIMQNDAHRISTLANIQAARVVASKDIEFYINDLHIAAHTDAKNTVEFRQIAERTLQTHECLDLATSLYTFSSLLEVFYARNYNSSYLSFLEQESALYLDKCEKRILPSLGHLQGRIASRLKGEERAKLEKRLADLSERVDFSRSSAVRECTRAISQSMTERSEYVICEDGRVFLRS